jgi:hypothetical protein
MIWLKSELMPSIVGGMKIILTGFHVTLILSAMYPDFFDQLISDGRRRAAELQSRDEHVPIWQAFRR